MEAFRRSKLFNDYMSNLKKNSISKLTIFFKSASLLNQITQCSCLSYFQLTQALKFE